MVTEIGETFTWGQWGLSANFTMVYTAVHWTLDRVTGIHCYLHRVFIAGARRTIFCWDVPLALFASLLCVWPWQYGEFNRFLGLLLVSRLLLLLGGTVGVKLVSNQARAVPRGWSTPLLTTLRRLD